MLQNRAIKHQMLASSSWASPSLLRMYEEEGAGGTQPTASVAAAAAAIAPLQ